MKILHVIDDMRVGGAEMLISEMLPIMKEKGHQPDVLLLSQSRKDLCENLTAHHINVFTSGAKRLFSLRNYRYILKTGKNYDIIHAHLFPANYLVSLVRISDKNKILITTEHNTFNKRRKYMVFSIIERFIYRSFNKVICISKMTERVLNHWLGGKIAGQTIVIENGINIKKFRQAKATGGKKAQKDHGKKIGMIGSFTPQKDQDTIIRAMTKIPECVKLYLVGEGPRKSELKELAMRLNLSSRVAFMGERKDIPVLLKSMDIIVVSSNWEGFGLVAVEAMASGIPVIASEVDGLREVVKDAGILFEKNNDIELSKEINHLLMNQDLYKKIAERCLERSKQYDIQSMAEKYLRVYQELFKGVRE